VVFIPNSSHIVIITDFIYVAQQIFDSSTHLYQVQSIAIAKDLRTFFDKDLLNTIKFWKYPSNTKWSHYIEVDKKIKQFNFFSFFPFKTS